MGQALGWAFYKILSYDLHNKPYEIGTVIIPILQMNNLRLTMVKQQGHGCSLQKI